MKSLFAVLLLRCPVCLKHSLRAEGSWFRFAPGCPRCCYRFEREEGYFSGASWMISYTLSVAAGLGSVILGKLFFAPQMNTMLLISLASVIVVLFAGFITPYSKAIWMVMDHMLHPLTEDDHCTLEETGQIRTEASSKKKHPDD